MGIDVLMSALEPLRQLYLQHPVAQSLGMVALITGFLAFAQKDDLRLKQFLSAYCAVIGLHFLLMGSYPGAISAWVSGTRAWASRRTNSLVWMFAFMLINIVLVVPGITAWIFVLPLFAACLGTWALFREKGMRMRFMMMIGTVCWLTHNMAIGSIGGTIIESSFLLINASTLYRLWREQKTSVVVK
ncbi:YgjV family protein [Gynuella sunshinyii]|nr:YgjV family protein [Gynuella sunshinyii]